MFIDYAGRLEERTKFRGSELGEDGERFGSEALFVVRKVQRKLDVPQFAREVRAVPT